VRSTSSSARALAPRAALRALIDELRALADSTHDDAVDGGKA
jgi:hypothetical protein